MKSNLVYILKRLLLRFGYQIRRINTFDALISLLDHILKEKGSVSFVQIGAYDGKADDPLYAFVKSNCLQVKGICIEPLRDAWEKLVENYKDCPGITPVNLCIHNTAKEIDLFRVDPARLPEVREWAFGISSVNPEHHKLTGIPSNVMITERVKCISLSELLSQYCVTHLDLLQIDTEGYDSEIIRNIDFQCISPSIIRFEHNFPGGIMTKKDLKSILGFLSTHGYRTMYDSMDAIAYKRSMIGAVLRVSR